MRTMGTSSNAQPGAGFQKDGGADAQGMELGPVSSTVRLEVNWPPPFSLVGNW